MDKSHHDFPAVPRSEPVCPPSSQELPSSPPSIASDAGPRRKPKKPPPVTPRSFKRFFTPRSMLNGGNSVESVKTNRQALKVLSSPAINRLGPAFTRPSMTDGNKATQNEAADVFRTPARKRKLSFSSVGSLQSSPLKRVRVKVPVNDEGELEVITRDPGVDCEATNVEKRSANIERPPSPVLPIRRSRALQTSGGLYMRNVLGSRADRVTIRSNSGTGWFSSPGTSLWYLHLTGF